MMEETSLINQVKEHLCSCAMDFVADMKSMSTSSDDHRPRKRHWLLPDFQTSMCGREINDPREHPAAAVLTLKSECIAIPELIFRPVDIGLDQGGVVEAIALAIAACPKEIQACLWANIRLSGGSSAFPQFVPRLAQDLLPEVLPSEDVGLEFSPASPSLLPFYGAQAYLVSRHFKLL